MFCRARQQYFSISTTKYATNVYVHHFNPVYIPFDLVLSAVTFAHYCGE